MLPGQVVTPGARAPASPPVVAPVAPPSEPPAPPAPDPQPAPVLPPVPSSTPPAPTTAGLSQAMVPEPPLPLQPHLSPQPAATIPGVSPALQQQATQEMSVDGMSWTATEFVHNEKNSTWYGAYTLGTILLSGLIFLMTRDFVSTGVVLLAVAGLIIYAGRKPTAQSYILDGDVLQAGNRPYYLGDFKAFSIIEEAAIVSIVLLPLKRLVPPLTVYLPRELEEQIIEHLSDFLPMEPHKPDAVDTLLRRIHF